MKYKQRIITGAFALTLLVGGTSSIKTYAGTTNSQGVYSSSTRNGALHIKDPGKVKSKVKHTVGTITAVSGTGFSFEVHHKASLTKGVEKVISVDAQTTATTTIKKDGLAATFADLEVGQKVIVSGRIHSADLIINATKVDIVTNFLKGKAIVKK